MKNVSGEITPLVHKDVKFIDFDNLLDYDWVEKDIPVVEELKILLR